MPIVLYNTLTRRKEELKTAEPGWVRIYVCGPTTYNLIHLGNARPLVFFDTVRRYLEYRGFRVTYIQNFTDIDDKIIRRAAEEGISPAEVAERYVREYYTDATALNVLPATANPRVSENLPEIIAMIAGLLEKGFAYPVEGNVYFEVRSFSSYGRLSGRSPDELRAGARVEVDERKRDPLDFALWKAAKEGEPAWDSPWGPGRPGWHIECSAMSLKYLGESFDLHGGGADLIFPHHENEIAQAEAFNGKTFARYWLHNGFITVNQEKMSKSLGNFFLVRDILARFPAPSVRYYLLSTHYRSPLDFDDGKLVESTRALDRLKGTVNLLREMLGNLKRDGEKQDAAEDKFRAELAAARAAFEAAMDDDFNTALALAALFDFCREVNSFAHRLSPPLGAGCVSLLEEALQLLKQLAEGVLGLWGAEGQKIAGEAHLVEALIGYLAELRQRAREGRDYGLADGIRERLKDLGILLEDTPQGTRWRRKD